MITKECCEKIIDTLHREEINEVFKGCKSYEEMAVLLNREGVEITAEDMQEFVQIMMNEATGELSDEELEQVAGGCFLCDWAKSIANYIERKYYD